MRHGHGSKPIHQSPKGRTGTAHHKMPRSQKRDGRITQWLMVNGRFVEAFP